MKRKNMQNLEDKYLKKDAYYTTEANLWKRMSGGQDRDEFVEELEELDEIKEKEPPISLVMMKVKWRIYYYSRNRFKKGTKGVFPGFLKKYKNELAALGIYSYKDFFGK